MSLPVTHSAIHSELRDLLDGLAARYTPDPWCRRRIVERTVSVIVDDSEHLGTGSLHQAMFRVLHQIAITEVRMDGDKQPAVRTPALRSASNGPGESECCSRSPLPLSGRRVLVVEDEYLVAAEMMATLERAGATVFGPISDVARAIEVLATPTFPLDAAVLDVKLGSELAYPVASALRIRRIPFVFVTGYSPSSILPEFTAAPCVLKPCDESELISAIAGKVL